MGGVGLGQNKSLQILEIGGNVYLIGVGENIQPLDKVSDLEEAQRIVDSFERDAVSQQGNLPPIIAKLAKRLRKEEPPREMEIEDTASFHEMFESNFGRCQTVKRRWRSSWIKTILQIGRGIHEEKDLVSVLFRRTYQPGIRYGGFCRADS